MRSESFGQQLKKYQLLLAVLLIALPLTCLTNSSPAGEKNYSSAAFKLVNITAEKARKQLSALGLGIDITTLESTNTLVVTTDSFTEKFKVASVLSLIDSKLEYEITKLSSNIKNPPNTALLDKAIKGIEVGSLTQPPKTKVAAKAIIDVQGKNLVAIAPKGLSKHIISGFNTLQAALEKEAAKNKTKETADAKEAKKSDLDQNPGKNTKISENKKAVDKNSPNPESTDNKKNVGVDLTDLSPTMRQFKEAQRQLNEALNKADADSVDKFINNDKNEKDLAKNNNINDALLKLLKRTTNNTGKSEKKAKSPNPQTISESKKSEPEVGPEKPLPQKNEQKIVGPIKPDTIKSEPAKVEVTPEKAEPKVEPKKAEPEKVESKKVELKKSQPEDKPEPNRAGRPDSSISGRTSDRTAAADREKTETTLPNRDDKKARPEKITAKPRTSEPGSQPSQKDPLAEILETVKAMNEGRNINRGKTDKAEKPAETGPKTNRSAVPGKPEKKDAKPKTDDAKNADKKKTTNDSKFPTDLSETELNTTINLPTKVQITKLLELVGMQLGLNYMYDPAQVSGEVTLFLHEDGKIKIRELYELVERVLKFKGYVMTRDGRLVIVVKEGDYSKVTTRVFREDENVNAAEIGNVIVTKIFKVDNIDTDTAQDMLSDMKLAINIRSIPEYGKMIVMGYAQDMNHIQEVLNLVDLPGKEKVFRDKTLKYVTPSKLAPKIEALSRELGTISISLSAKSAAASPSSPSSPSVDTSKMSAAQKRAHLIQKAREDAERRRALANRSSTNTQTSSIGTKTSKDVYLDIDDRTNRILMIGVPKTIEIVENLIDTLDVKQQGIMAIRQYRIQYVDASMIMDILNELAITSIQARPVTAPNPRGGNTPTTRGSSPSEEGPKISILLDTNSLLVNATHEKHDEIMAIIEHVDVLNPDQRKIKKYDIQHVDTQEILDTLGELKIINPQTNSMQSSRFGSQQTRRTPQSNTGSNPTTQARPETPSISTQFSEPLADEPEIAVLETTNSLLVNATPKQHASIEMVIQYVDRGPTQNSTPYVIYPLENQDPEALKPILDELVNATIESKTAAKPATSSGTTPSKIISAPKTSGIRHQDEQIKIVSDPATYSLVVYASKKNQLWIGNLIAELDAYRPQVLLDVTLVEISKNDDFSYDLNLLSSIPDMTTTSGITGSVVEGISSSDILNQLLTSNKNNFMDMQADSGNFTAFYGDKKIMALFKAMQKKSYGRILAKPKLLVDDNQSGTIVTKNTVYVERETSSYQSVDGGNPIQTQNTSFDPYHAQISLSIKPHISKGENLRLEIELNRSDFVDLQASSTKPPGQAESDVSTVATVPNNHTIVLGGMDRINQSKGGSKIPILGDLPFIGGLFRSTDNTSSQRKLYVFVKAHILRPGEELDKNSDIINISKRHRREFEKYETEMQKYEDWPGIKPRPMDPPQILESDDDTDSITELDIQAARRAAKEKADRRKKTYVEIELD